MYIIKHDISPKDSNTIKDDILNANLECYRDMNIIYSIRPPSENSTLFNRITRKN